MQINDLIKEALNILRKDDSPGHTNPNYINGELNGPHTLSTSLDWKYNTAPPAAKFRELQTAKITGINDKDTHRLLKNKV